MSETTERLEAAMEKYAPPGYDPASDDLTIPFAMELIEKDREIERLRAALSWIEDHEPALVESAHQRFALEQEVGEPESRCIHGVSMDQVCGQCCGYK
jgi:hypothetical protein